MGAGLVHAQAISTPGTPLFESEGSETTTEEVPESEDTDRVAVINGGNSVEVNRAAIFDASGSVLPEGVSEDQVVYRWSFGDGNQDEGLEVVHSYESPGDYTIELQIEIEGNVYAKTTSTIFVYADYYVLLTDQSKEEEKIENLMAFARDRGIFVVLLSDYDSVSEFVTEEALLRQMNESISVLQKASLVVVWMEGSNGLTLLSRFTQSLSDPSLFSSKAVVVISDSSFSTLGNIAEGTYGLVGPKQMILTRPEALWMLFEQSDLGLFVEDLESRGVSYVDVAENPEFRVWNALSFLTNYLIKQGMPTNSLLLVLMLPFIVTIVAFFKQVIGFSTLGVYTPSIITLSFIALDLKFGLLMFGVILLFGILIRSGLSRFRLLYIPRMAIVLTCMSFLILFILLLGSYFNVSDLVSISIFPMLIMTTLVEKFLSIQSERGVSQAVFMIGSTLLVSTVAYFVVEWSFIKTLVLGHPEVILLCLLANFFLGRWGGLRLMEFVRFREILRYHEEE